MEDLVRPRIEAPNASEDLVFYFLNLLLIKGYDYDAEEMRSAMLNAINLNPDRFCLLFRPNDKGGVSMQLLDHGAIRSRYCEICR